MIRVVDILAMYPEIFKITCFRNSMYYLNLKSHGSRTLKLSEVFLSGKLNFSQDSVLD